MRASRAMADHVWRSARTFFLSLTASFSICKPCELALHFSNISLSPYSPPPRRSEPGRFLFDVFLLRYYA